MKIYKKILMLILCIVINDYAYTQTTETNDFYDNDTTYHLKIPEIFVGGEITNPGVVDFSKLTLRSEIVKEAIINDNGDTIFTGAFRYDGYSLYDILNNYIVEKKNFEEYNLITDLYVEIENIYGEIVLVSWGEIYYPANRHNIFIAKSVMRIIPSKTKDMWELPMKSKLIVGTDLFTLRNISEPSKITVKSFAQSFKVTRNMENMYAPEIKIYKNEIVIETLTEYPKHFEKIDYNTIFYGRGRGLHKTGVISGIPIKKIIDKHIKANNNDLKKTLVVIAAKDGYRSVFTYSEIANRNDFQDILLIDRSDDKKNGAYSIFIAPDFFSDRAVKAITEIKIIQ